MSTQRNTTIRFMTVPFDNSYEHVRYFSTLEAQTAYFSGLADGYRTYRNYTYQRWNQTIKVAQNVEELYACNYCMFQNGDFNNKWVYAFIVEKRYVNGATPEIVIEIDPFQTWMTEMRFIQCFVEREHVTNDAFGANTIPEGLEYGDYIVASYNVNTDTYNTGYMMTVTETPDGEPATGGNVGNVYQALDYYTFQASADMTEFIDQYNERGKIDAITGIFAIPRDLFPSFSSGGKFQQPTMIPTSWTPVTRPTSIDGYTPRNNKVLCYPYTALYITNNNGSGNEYRFEDFDGSPEFEVKGALVPNAIAYIRPTNYKGQEYSLDYALTVGPWPMVPWNSDEFSNWYAQNSAALERNAFKAVGQAITGAALLASGVGSVAGIGLIAASFNTALNSSVQVTQAQIVPDSSRGSIGNFTAIMQQIFQYAIAEVKTIKREYAVTLDNFFTRFGYKVNRVKVPNYNTRSTYNYFKTAGVCIQGQIPSEHLQVMNNACINGVTFWHTNNIGTY